MADPAAGTGQSSQAGTCPACGASGPEVFHEQPSIPVNSCLLLDDREEARSFPRGSLRLGLCGECGFISNTTFDPDLAEYSARYEERQGFSPRFREFAEALARRWVETYALQGKTVLEIGCGKGDFLLLLAEQGIGHGVGIDPILDPGAHGDSDRRVSWIADTYSEGYAHLHADAVVCRHTLEHLWPVGDFLRMLRQALEEQPDTVALFEVPDTLRVLREAAFWDVYYEHCSYFTAGSLARLFRSCGFEVLDLRLDYGDQYLLIEARPTANPGAGRVFDLEEPVGVVQQAAADFAAGYPKKLAAWRDDLAELERRGERAVIWGASSKGVAYLNGLGVTGGIEYAVDINPFKHGMYLAGTGQQVVAPEFLRDYRPDHVIAMNPVYLEEIRRDLERLGIEAELTAV